MDPVRHGEAVVRSAEFFNCNPNLAGLALGRPARAEYEARARRAGRRLRTALCGPLGAMGDQLFWAGLVPALVGLALAAVVLGAGCGPSPGSCWSTTRCGSGPAWWSLRTGLDAGMRVGAAVGSSWLPRAIERVGPGGRRSRSALAIPLVAAWY